MSLVGDKYMIGDELKTPKELWFEEYLKESTKQRYEYDFNDFCEWAKTSDVHACRRLLPKGRLQKRLRIR